MTTSNSKARAVGAAPGFHEHRKADVGNFAKGPPRLQEAALCERFRSAGFALYPFEGGKFIVSRWGLWRTLDGTAEAESWLRKIGGARG